ncbi:MAG: MmcQ/YjbR family DNA-binding protein [Chitinophagaceae bacterium]|nr:MAG: MmcQ/YjbR family DNA-binding protein [Chitinophagaceae bacterium]
MDIQQIIDFCDSLPETEQSFPFDEQSLVIKVNHKIFAILSLNSEQPSINLKCNSEIIDELRAVYPSILPGYHMNKKHWNTVMLDGTIQADYILILICHSYLMVIEKMTVKDKTRIKKALNEVNQFRADIKVLLK